MKSIFQLAAADLSRGRTIASLQKVLGLDQSKAQRAVSKRITIWKIRLIDNSTKAIPPPAFDPMALQRTGSMDSNGFDQYPLNGINQPVFPQNSNMPLAAMASQQAQLQYHQAALAASRPNNFYPLMNGFQNPAPGLDAFRNVSPIAAPGMTGSPMLQQAGFGQGIGPVMSPQIYPYGMYMPQQQQQIAAGQRRGRVSTVFHTTTSNVRWTAENLAELTEK
jgi:hypothetical protein